MSFFVRKTPEIFSKVINKIGQLPRILVIDDEADFASPNAKINQAEQTKINELISHLLGSTGDYIGVTATPARLDLNNTFRNDSQLWVNFPPHNMYTGQDVFFPLDRGNGRNSLPFQLTLLPEKGDDPRYARQALFSFLVNVAYLNRYVNETETNYSMLVHTSGKKVDHKSDWATVQDTLASLVNHNSKKFDHYLLAIWTLAKDRYPDADPNKLTSYLVENVSRNAIIILNSDRDFARNGTAATKPSSLFTIVIGGNIVSRGVTFDNLLSMFFTRDVKHKIQQDTYIQRARMFGARDKYLNFFELTIPNQLYLDWHRCFVFHKLALEAIKEGMGSPVWLSDSRIAAVSSSSIDRSTVDLDKGEMAFRIFKFETRLDDLVESKTSIADKLAKLGDVLGDSAFPQYLKRFIVRTSGNVDQDIVIHTSSSVEGYKDEPGLDKAAIERRRGFFGRSQMGANSRAFHHLKIFRNGAGNGRLFYKFNGSIQFIKNVK